MNDRPPPYDRQAPGLPPRLPFQSITPGGTPSGLSARAAGTPRLNVPPTPRPGAAPLAGTRFGQAAAGPAGDRPIRVLIVDDSVLMRQAVRRLLSADPGIEVVDVARDGLEALAKAEKLQPDVLTMDVEMPHMDGLSALKMLMERFPRPVVMLSSLTAAGAEATVKALALGAVDFMQKPSANVSGGLTALGDDLVAKVKRASQARVRKPLLAAPAARATPSLGGASAATSVRPSLLASARLPGQAAAPLAPAGPGREPDRLLVIGSSTGGPRALAEVVSGLPADLPCAVLIVQHLPAGFTKSLADRLNQGSPLDVSEAKDGDLLSVGRVLVAPGDFHLKVAGRRVQLEMGPRRHGVRPSVDTTLETAATSFGQAILTVILTGMGEDGTDGARAVKAAGGLVLAEDESTCVVYGMPRSIVEHGLSDEVVPLDHMAEAIVRHLPTLRSRFPKRQR
ncbi:MAG: chemotaxis response regulator protein-glutamate methylesterase [Chloroflexota bacterium]